MNGTCERYDEASKRFAVAPKGFAGPSSPACRGQDLWWQVQEDLEASVRTMADRLGPPDLLLLSGDLTNTGARPQFDRVDRLLDTLLGWLAKSGGAAPLIMAVPGNHDVQRPTAAKELDYLILDRYVEAGLEDSHVRRMEETLWTKRNVSRIKPLFSHYQAWFERRLLPDLQSRATVHRSRGCGRGSSRFSATLAGTGAARSW